jgi:hypothetical protein
MKVFISWSGEESGAVAQVLRQQLPCIIQAVKPFVSSEDIEKGAAWFQQIGSELEKSDFGILCLTNSNQNSKWVQFEAGALAGKFSKARIAPLLIDTTPTSIKPPLSQFQLTDINNKEDFFKLLLSINACLGDGALSQETLQEIFNNWWNPFNQKVKAAVAKISKKEIKKAERSEKEILEELLSLTRSIASNLSQGGNVATDLYPSDNASIYKRFIAESNKENAAEDGKDLFRRMREAIGETKHSPK